MNETGTEAFQPVPGDGWVPGCFTENRNKIPWQALEPYAGKYVAFSLDGTCIVASGDDRNHFMRALMIWESLPRTPLSITSIL